MLECIVSLTMLLCLVIVWGFYLLFRVYDLSKENDRLYLKNTQARLKVFRLNKRIKETSDSLAIINKKLRALNADFKKD